VEFMRASTGACRFTNSNHIKCRWNIRHGYESRRSWCNPCINWLCWFRSRTRASL